MNELGVLENDQQLDQFATQVESPKRSVQRRLFYSGLIIFAVLFLGYLFSRLDEVPYIINGWKYQLAHSGKLSPELSQRLYPISVAPSPSPYQPTYLPAYRAPSASLVKVIGEDKKEVLKFENEFKFTSWSNLILYPDSSTQGSLDKSIDILSYNFDFPIILTEK